MERNIATIESRRNDVVARETLGFRGKL